MKTILILFVHVPIVLFSQPDTARIKSRVPVTDEYYAHKEFWYQINYRDQELRKRPDIEQMDEENLLAVVYYYNKFGFPDVKRLGDHAKVIRGVWGHIRDHKIKQYTFPIMLEAYYSGLIPEAAYREYYLRQLCQLRSDTYAYKTLSVDSIQNLLDLKRRDELSIDTVLSMLSAYKEIRGDTQRILGRWYAITPADTFYFEGKQLVKKGERHKVMLYQTSKGKYYLAQESFANAVEPVELAPMDPQMTKFRMEGKESSKYYLITANHELWYTDDQRNTYKSYAACR